MKNTLQKANKVKLINEAIQRGDKSKDPKAELLSDGRIEYTILGKTASGNSYRMKVNFNDILSQLQGEDMRRLHNLYGAGRIPKVAPIDNMATKKEPWQMTREEYKTNLRIKQGSTEGIGWFEGAQGKAAESMHSESIKQALSEGKPVPPEVLKDYPELAKNVPTGIVKRADAQRLLDKAFSKDLVTKSPQYLQDLLRDLRDIERRALKEGVDTKVGSLYNQGWIIHNLSEAINKVAKAREIQTPMETQAILTKKTPLTKSEIENYTGRMEMFDGKTYRGSDFANEELKTMTQARMKKDKEPSMNDYRVIQSDDELRQEIKRRTDIYERQYIDWVKGNYKGQPPHEPGGISKDMLMSIRLQARPQPPAETKAEPVKVESYLVGVEQKVRLPHREHDDTIERTFTVQAKTASQAEKAVRDSGIKGKILPAVREKHQYPLAETLNEKALARYSGAKNPYENPINKSQRNPIVLYGGVPVYYGTVVRHLDETARATGKENWMSLRDAGLMGFSQFKQPELPDDVQPLTYEEFKIVSNMPSGHKVPTAIWNKWVTMYRKEDRARFESKSSTKPIIPDLERKESARSALSRLMDERQPHSITIDKNDPRVKLWLKDQGRADIRGIDTPRYRPPKMSTPKRKVSPTLPSHKRGKMYFTKLGWATGISRHPIKRSKRR